MKPTIVERDGVRVAVAVQVIRPASCDGAHGRRRQLTADELEDRRADRAEQLEVVGFALRFLLVQVVYAIGLGFALAFWLVGRAGDALRAVEAGMGGSPRRLTQPLLPPWMRQETALDELPPPAPEPRTFQSGHRLRLPAGGIEDEDE